MHPATTGLSGARFRSVTVNGTELLESRRGPGLYRAEGDTTPVAAGAGRPGRVRGTCLCRRAAAVARSL